MRWGKRRGCEGKRLLLCLAFPVPGVCLSSCCCRTQKNDSSMAGRFAASMQVTSLGMQREAPLPPRPSGATSTCQHHPIPAVALPLGLRHSLCCWLPPVAFSQQYIGLFRAHLGCLSKALSPSCSSASLMSACVLPRQVGLDQQTVMLVCTNRRKQFLLDTADVALTE